MPATRGDALGVQRAAECLGAMPGALAPARLQPRGGADHFCDSVHTAPPRPPCANRKYSQIMAVKSGLHWSLGVLVCVWS